MLTLIFSLLLSPTPVTPQHPPRPQVDRARPSPGANPSGEQGLRELLVRYSETGGRVFEGGIAPGSPPLLKWTPLSLEGYRGAERAMEGFGRLRTSDGQPGPTV